MVVSKNDKPRFEKVSRVKDLEFSLPKRGTKQACGYDFYLIEDVTIQPKQTVMIPTGVKAYMPEGMYLQLGLRSSAYKVGAMLANSTGYVDSDYYNNPSNEGEIGFPIINFGELPINLKKGDRIGQGVFVKYYITSDDNTTNERVGGFGSSGK